MKKTKQKKTQKNVNPVVPPMGGMNTLDMLGGVVTPTRPKKIKGKK